MACTCPWQCLLLALPSVNTVSYDLTPAVVCWLTLSRCNIACLDATLTVLYGCGGKMLAANLIFMISLSGWVAGLAFVGLMIIKHSVGLRVPVEEEEVGMDKSRHPRHGKGSVALRRALRSAAGKDSSAGSSQRASFKSSHASSPRMVPATLSHWKD